MPGAEVTLGDVCVCVTGPRGRKECDVITQGMFRAREERERVVSAHLRA